MVLGDLDTVVPSLFNIRGTPEFETDGCSGYISYIWTEVLGREPFLRDCCVEHDKLYWMGEGSRLEADLGIYRCIRDLGYPGLATIFFLGIRIGGSEYLPFSWRWRYRKPWLS
jgi:hypothetical protein